MSAYYNEHDPKAAAWLRELIKQGHIADGEVDERSIEDVTPNELTRFTQCHFFAGIGVWSYALRRAGWDDSRPVWTGSCPCQPFSAAGKGGGFDDERHLWPAFFHLIEQCRPDTVFGEQVASKDGLAWLDLVQSDLEGAGYAVGAIDTCAAGFGAPHIRQRLYWVADAELRGLEQQPSSSGESAGIQLETPKQAECLQPIGGCGASSNLMAHTGGAGLEIVGLEQARGQCQAVERGVTVSRPSPTNGHWRDADWLRCRDGKWRPVESGTFPLAHGAPARMGRLRGYGNAICAPVAEGFISAYLEAVA